MPPNPVASERSSRLSLLWLPKRERANTLFSAAQFATVEVGPLECQKNVRMSESYDPVGISGRGLYIAHSETNQ